MTACTVLKVRISKKTVMFVTIYKKMVFEPFKIVRMNIQNSFFIATVAVILPYKHTISTEMYKGTYMYEGILVGIVALYKIIVDDVPNISETKF